jgi:hypothetical protein
VHATFFGVAANGALSFASRAQAAARWGSVPAAGAHLRVYVRFGACPCPFGQTVTWSEVDAKRMAARTFISPG